MMNYLLLGAAAVVGLVLYKRSRDAAHAPGLDHADTWTLVKGAAPKVPQPNGSVIPIWYRSPVDPSQRWAALVKQHADQPLAFQAVVLGIMVQAVKPGAKFPGPLVMSVQVQSQSAAADGSLSGVIIRDIVDMRTLGFSGQEDSWMPPLGTVVSFTPSDVVVEIQA